MAKKRSRRIRKNCSEFLPKIVNAQECRCFYCGDSLNGNVDITADHFFPVSRGGVKGITNIVASCCRCNVEKSNRLPVLEEVRRFLELSFAVEPGYIGDLMRKNIRVLMKKTIEDDEKPKNS